MNKDVPDKTIIRHLSIENGKLKSEIQYLEDEIVRRDKAIEAFKHWQSRVAEYKWDYWLGEGISLMENPPSKDSVERLRSLLAKADMFNSAIAFLETCYDRYMDTIATMKSEDNTEQQQLKK